MMVDRKLERFDRISGLTTGNGVVEVGWLCYSIEVLTGFGSLSEPPAYLLTRQIDRLALQLIILSVQVPQVRFQT